MYFQKYAELIVFIVLRSGVPLSKYLGLNHLANTSSMQRAASLVLGNDGHSESKAPHKRVQFPLP